MFTILRIVFAVGLLSAMGFAVSYLLTGHYRNLIMAGRIFVATIVAAIVVLIGIYVEHMFW